MNGGKKEFWFSFYNVVLFTPTAYRSANRANHSKELERENGQNSFFILADFAKNPNTFRPVFFNVSGCKFAGIRFGCIRPEVRI